MSGVETELQAALARPSSVLHRWERPMLWVCGLITCIAVAFLGLALSGALPAELVAEFNGESGNDLAIIALLAPLAPLFFYIVRFFIAAGVRANAIKVGPQQFPDIHARYQEIARRIGLEHVPALYIVNGHGVVNAYALSCNRRRNYVVIHAEIAQMRARSPGTLDFVLAHELAHHKLGHVSLWRILIGVIPNILVLPGRTMTRAQEYSADRMALCACPKTSDTTSLLAIGPVMAPDVNAAAWLEQCCEEERSPMIRAHNALSDHAVMTKRYKALKDMETHGLRKHGSMF